MLDWISARGICSKDFKGNVKDAQFLDRIPPDAKLYETITTIEKMMIKRALKLTNNVQSKAAELLGIGKSGFNKKINKYQID